MLNLFVKIFKMKYIYSGRSLATVLLNFLRQKQRNKELAEPVMQKTPTLQYAVTSKLIWTFENWIIKELPEHLPS